MIRFLLIQIIISVIVFFQPALFSQVKEPVVDDVTDVVLNAAETAEKYKVKVTLYGKEPFAGEVILNAGASVNPSGDKGRIYPFRDINRITVIKWSKQRKGSGWIFYPDSYEIILRDKTRIMHNGNLEFLNRIKLVRDSGKSVYLYTYYYDYYKDGKWINSGASGAETIPVNPAAGTLYIIELK